MPCRGTVGVGPPPVKEGWPAQGGARDVSVHSGATSHELGEQVKDLEGKTALVTGSGRNNGRAIVLELASMGANVIVNARTNGAEADAVADEVRALGAQAVVTLGDIAEQSTIDRVLEDAQRAFGGGVDISISNAATRPYQSFFDLPVEDFARIIDLQLVTAFRLAKAFAPGMIEHRWGRIIHILGYDAFAPSDNRMHVTAAKGGIRALTKGLAWELGAYGITVNDVAPARIDHPERESSHPIVTIDAPDKPKPTEDRLATVPVGRAGTPEDVAYACGFLASTRASYLSGIVVPAAGGRIMLP